MATEKFEELALDGCNYPTWASVIKIALASRSLLATIQEPHNKGLSCKKSIPILLWLYYGFTFIRTLNLNTL
jgi:hypothetical protein